MTSTPNKDPMVEKIVETAFQAVMEDIGKRYRVSDTLSDVLSDSLSEHLPKALLRFKEEVEGEMREKMLAALPKPLEVDHKHDTPKTHKNRKSRTDYYNLALQHVRAKLLSK